jgi:DNA-binding transcriptional MerR regulator
MQEEKILPVEEIIEKAKNLGVRFGQGEPYNRLRYYTKLNWIPHMERKGKNVQGHYPTWVIDRLKLIQDLKDKGKTNDEIAEEINKSETINKIQKIIKNKKYIKYMYVGCFAIIISLLLLNELGIIKISKTGKDISPMQKEETSIFP